MPDSIERTIYKLEIDDSGYISGVESMSASTQKLVAVQSEANNKLRESEAALKANAAIVEKNKIIVDEVAKSANRKFGDDTRAITNLKKSQEEQQRLTDIVDANRKAYEAATKAAQDFANTTERATNLQPPGGGRVNPPIVPPIIQPDIFTDLTGLSGLDEIVANTKQEFNDLQAAIILCEEVLKDFDPGSEEFNVLTDVIAKGKQALLDYEEASKKSETGTKSLRQEITAANLELKKLEEQGKENTQEYIDQEKVLIRLTNEYNNQRERIKLLASDTLALDFGKSAIQTAISVFQTYTSLTILAGGASEDLQKKTIQLFAAMQLLSSLEQLSVSVKRLSIQATGIQTVVQGVYTAAIGASTGALKAFKVALLSTGIGAAVVLVGLLVKKYIDYKNAVDEAADNQKILNEVVAEGNKEAGRQIADLKILTQAARDVNLPLEERLKAVQALQKEFPDYFGNLSKEAILTGDIKDQTDALTKSIQAVSRARAAKGKIDAIESQRLDLDFQRQKVINATNAEAARVKPPEATPRVVATGGTAPIIIQPLTVQQQQEIITQRRNEALADIKAKDDALTRQEDFLVKFVGLDEIAKVTEKPEEKAKKEKTKAAIREIENEFSRKKAELDARLAEVTAKEADDESKIRIQFATRLAKEQLAIDELLKDKKITKPQAQILKDENIQINTAELDKALSDLRKRILDAQSKIQNELKALQEKNILDSINLIQDDFDRRASLIEFNEGREIEAAKVANQKRLEALDLQKGLIPLQEFEDAQAAIVEAGERNLLNITRRFAEERNKLAIDKFNEFLTFIDSAISDLNLGIDEGLAKEIRDQSNRFLSGKISFEQYQKEITAIQRREESIRRDRTLFLQKAEIDDLQIHLDSIADKTSKEFIDLNEKIKRLRKKFADDEKSDAQADANDVNAEDSEESARLANIRGIADAIGEVTTSIIGFWQKANEAEAAAIDRSISLQEKRVDAAQKIAERGNASYLKAETDRLKELQVARENAARRELAINAALQASQLLVGITGAITKIADPVSGPAEVIASIAVIFAALATGYGLVKSLQGNQPQFKEGTKSVRRAGQPAGVDTIQAWVSEGEAIIPARTNKEYHPSVSAIYDKKIPAEVLNRYVNNYVNNRVEKIHTVRPIAQPNYERIGEAATTHIQHDSKLAGLLVEQNRKIEENNDLQRATIRALNKMGVSVNMDRNGIAVSVMEVIDQQRKDSRT